MKIITNVKQMHNRPSRRCYVFSVDDRPLYRLDYMWEGNQRWYGWIGMTTDSKVTSVINPFFPMSDTAKGAVRNELGKEKPSGIYDVPGWPIIIYEFENFKQATEYFPALPLHIKYINYKKQTDAGWTSGLSRGAHIPKIRGSNPLPANTNTN